MRGHEQSLYTDYKNILYLSNESKTVIEDGEILTIYGIFANNGLWQIPSKAIKDNMFRYARNCQQPIKDLIAGKEVFSVCLDDELHNRWMKFIGFKKLIRSAAKA